MGKSGKSKDGKHGGDRKHGKKSRKEDEMDSGEGLPVTEDFVDDFEAATPDSDDEHVATSSKPMGRKQLLKAAAAASGAKSGKPGKITKKTGASAEAKDGKDSGPAPFRNRQRVMALSSRGITQR